MVVTAVAVLCVASCAPVNPCKWSSQRLCLSEAIIPASRLTLLQCASDVENRYCRPILGLLCLSPSYRLTQF